MKTHVDYTIYKFGPNGVEVDEGIFDCDYFRTDREGVYFKLIIAENEYSTDYIYISLTWEELPNHCAFFAYAD